jgi:hypothetical protein
LGMKFQFAGCPAHSLITILNSFSPVPFSWLYHIRIVLEAPLLAVGNYPALWVVCPQWWCLFAFWDEMMLTKRGGGHSKQDQHNGTGEAVTWGVTFCSLLRTKINFSRLLMLWPLINSNLNMLCSSLKKSISRIMMPVTFSISVWKICVLNCNKVVNESCSVYNWKGSVAEFLMTWKDI